MKLSVSNIALPPNDHAAELHQLSALGVPGLEVAPSRIWEDTWHGLKAGDVSLYRRQIEEAGLEVVGLHSLLFDHPELSLFADEASRADLMEFFSHLSAVCRDLGGRTLIWGGGRRRGPVPERQAEVEATRFMGELAKRIESHGTVFCFEPLGPDDSDFINSALTSLEIVQAVDHPAVAVQLDAKALVENDEIDSGLFEAVAGQLVHVHANEPGLGVIGSTGEVDHAAIGHELRRVGYAGFVSVEQRMLSSEDPMPDIATSVESVREYYING